MNAHPNSAFWVFFDVDPFKAYKQEGLLKGNIKFGDEKNSDYLVLNSRLGRFNEIAWEYYKHKKPLFSVGLSKTNLVSIYALEKK